MIPVSRERGKNEELTYEEFEGYQLNPAILEYIEDFRRRRGLGSAECRVLDWGCGRGRTVLRLRANGIDAYGIDIDAAVVDQSRKVFARFGLDVDQYLWLTDRMGRTPFEDGYFDLIISDQVLEHMENPSVDVREMSRLLHEDGAMLHCFPGHRGVVESHVHMPFVHWIAKRATRRFVIRAWLRAGVDPVWPRALGLRLDEQVELYADYLNNKTFYRSPGQWRRIFDEAGLVTGINPRRSRSFNRLEGVYRVPILAQALGYLFTTFKTVYLEAAKQRSALEDIVH